jgi:hypothetical protein
VNPSYNLHNNGLKFSLQGSTGVLFAQEFGKTVQLGAASMPGHYKIGGYYDTSEAPSVTNAQLIFAGRYGGYLLADQMVRSFQPGTDRGLIVSANAAVSDKRTLNDHTLLYHRLDSARSICRPATRFHRSRLRPGFSQSQPGHEAAGFARRTRLSESRAAAGGEYCGNRIRVAGDTLVVDPSQSAIYRQSGRILLPAYPECMGVWCSHRARLLSEGRIHTGQPRHRQRDIAMETSSSAGISSVAPFLVPCRCMTTPSLFCSHTSVAPVRCVYVPEKLAALVSL